MTDEERIRRAVEEDTYVGDVAPLLAAEVERLRADRAALLGLWVLPNGGGWQVRSEDIPPPVYATRDEAEAAVLAWARGRALAEDGGR